MLKKTICILILLIICISITLPVLSINTTEYEPNLSGAGNDKIKHIGNVVVKVIKIIGSAISVIALAIIGIKYIYGSMEQKAQYKETIMPYIVGAILLFGASNLVDMIYSMAIQI